MPLWQPSDLNSLSEEEHFLGSQVSENGQTDSFASFLHIILSTFFTNDTLAVKKKIIMNLEYINISKYKDPCTAQDQDPIVPQTSTKHAHKYHSFSNCPRGEISLTASKPLFVLSLFPSSHFFSGKNKKINNIFSIK
jgi:hypothetical protein